MDHKEAFELIPAYAVGALSAADHQQVQVHLSDCRACQAELETYQGTLDALTLAIPYHEPQPNLKQRIMAKAKPAGPMGAHHRTPSWQRAVGWLTRSAPAWGVVSLVLVAVLAINNLLLWQRVANLEKVDKFQTVALVGAPRAPEGSGILVISTDGIEGTLVVEHLPALDAAYQYQLWLIRDGKRTSGGVFSVDEGGYAILRIDSSEPLTAYDAFGVTIEPFGGSPGPTGDKVLGSES